MNHGILRGWPLTNLNAACISAMRKKKRNVTAKSTHFFTKRIICIISLSFLKIAQASATVLFWYWGCLLEGNSGAQPSVRGHYSPPFIGRERTKLQNRADDGRSWQPKELLSNEPGLHVSILIASLLN